VPKYLSTSIIIIVLACNCFAQNKYNLQQFQNESLDFIQQPTKWESNDWLKLGLVGAATFLAMQADQPVRDEFLKDRSYNKSVPIEFGRMWGEVYTPVAIAGAFGLHGLLAKDNSTKKIGYEIIQTTIYAGAITTALKLAFGRARPFTNEGSKSFGNWSFLDDSFHSLPSGHTTIAFSVSTVLAKNAKSDLVKILCYVPAVLTAVSRVYQDKHWVSDVFLGGIIGYTVGDWVTSKHEENKMIQIPSPQQISIVIPLN
jgi:hypothetical protein